MEKNLLKIIDTKKESAIKNMSIDAVLLDTLKDQPILHFYDWDKNSLTYGYFIDIEKFIDLKKANLLNLKMARRPTGGGIVFHIWDIAFSFLLPKSNENFSLNPLKNYEFVNMLVLDSIKGFLDERFSKDELYDQDIKNENIDVSTRINLSLVEHKNKKIKLDSFCMAKPTRYDVMYLGKKIAGASQRRTKKGFLHQTSICLIKPDFDYLKKVLKDSDAIDAIAKSSFPIFLDGKIDQRREIIKEKLIQTFKSKFFK